MKLPTSGAPTAVLSKDLRLRMRGWRWAGVATMYVGILACVSLAFLLQKYAPSSNQSAREGIDLFQALSICQLLLIVFVTPATLAGAISGERQHRTWDLLVASRAHAVDIVWGKLLAGIAFNAVLLAASVPLFGLIFLFGGIVPTDVIPAFLVFLVTMLLLGATSLMVSALTARLTVSFMLSLLIALMLAVGLSILTLFLQSPGQPDVLTLGGVPFQSAAQPSSLTPLAQLDPLVALLSALPAQSGGSLLGGLGTINRAFGLPWQLPLWGAYSLLMGVIALLLVIATTRLVRSPRALRTRGAELPWHAAREPQ